MAINAVETFTAIANATAAVYAKCPAFATYHVHTNLHFLQKDTVIERDISVRSADQVAVVYDDATKKDSLKAPFPAPPNFDGLSKFDSQGTFSATVGRGSNLGVDFRIENIAPLMYHDVPSHADAVAKSIRGYSVSFASDTTPEIGHLLFAPVTDETRGAKLHLAEVYYAPATLLPTRIIERGPSNSLLDASYAIVGGNWLLATLHFRHTWYGIALFAKTTGEFTAAYDNYHFSDTAPDPRLAAASTSPPNPT
jgi:hypothetical protein